VSIGMTIPTMAIITSALCAPTASQLGLGPIAVSQPAPGVMS
jgi:hypothetical protein